MSPLLLLQWGRQALCLHPDTLRTTSADGRLYLQCLACGHASPGIPVGPGWTLVHEGRNEEATHG